MYFISSLICTKSNKNMFVKIVHHGGRVEIYDRPISVAEILRRNPKCCVANPDVFRQPYAVVLPSATLALGQKYYVVPIQTIARLQLKYTCSKGKPPRPQSDDRKRKEEHSSAWWLKKSKKNGGKECLEEREGDCRRESGDKIGGRGLSLAHLDQWQPGLESIMEE